MSGRQVEGEMERWRDDGVMASTQAHFGSTRKTRKVFQSGQSTKVLEA